MLKPEAKKGFSFKKEEREVNDTSPTRSSSWARLLSRVFGVDVLKCECGSELKLVSAIVKRDEVKRYPLAKLASSPRCRSSWLRRNPFRR